VEVQDITAELAESFRLPKSGGVVIAGVLRNGPADRAGIKPGDVLTEVNGNPVTDSATMLTQIAALPPEKTATLKIIRNQTEAQMRVTIGKRPKMRQNDNHGE